MESQPQNLEFRNDPDNLSSTDWAETKFQGNLLDIIVDIQIHNLQMFLILPSISFHGDQSFSDSFLDTVSQFLNMGLMFTDRFQQWSTRPENLLKNVLQ